MNIAVAVNKISKVILIYFIYVKSLAPPVGNNRFFVFSFFDYNGALLIVYNGLVIITGLCVYKFYINALLMYNEPSIIPRLFFRIEDIPVTAHIKFVVTRLCPPWLRKALFSEKVFFTVYFNERSLHYAFLVKVVVFTVYCAFRYRSVSVVIIVFFTFFRIAPSRLHNAVCTEKVKVSVYFLLAGLHIAVLRKIEPFTVVVYPSGLHNAVR